MKKIYTFILIIFSFIYFSSCGSINSTLNPQLIPRENNKIPIEGKWTVYKYAFAGMTNLTEHEANGWIGKKAVFTKENITFNNETCKNPQYKLKIVDTKTYFLDEYKINPSSMGVSQDKIKIITIASNDNLFSNFIKLNENYIITYKEGLFLFLKKDGTSDKDIMPNSNFIPPHEDESRLLHSGLLIGLRYTTKVPYKIPFLNPDENIEYHYRTLWISSRDGVFAPVYDVQNILAPRKSGFWILGVQRTHGSNFVEDYVIANPISKTKKTDIKQTDKQETEKQIYYNINSINFIANEYISIEHKSKGVYTDGTNKWDSYFLNVLPITNINSNPLKISSVLGETSRNALFYGAQVFRNSLSEDARNAIEENPNETNWGIKRLNGNWMLIGRLNSVSDKYANLYRDFDIPFPALKRFIDYDEIYPSWQAIKRKVPNAIDAYSSPNKDFIVIQTQQKLFVYTINNYQVGDFKIEINLNENETPIMAQWATGEYVKRWTDIVKNVKHK